MMYDHATRTVALAQAKDRDLRTKYSGGLFEATDINLDDSVSVQSWLTDNMLRGPIETPPQIKEAVKKLGVLIGEPNKDNMNNDNDFARVSTVRIKRSSFTSGPVRRTTYKETERFDYTQQNKSHSPFVSAACAEIVWEFLATTGYGNFLQAILEREYAPNTEPRIYAHVDWYPNRTYQAETWHRDTRGFTLFVGLIYMNENEIQAADVIDNPWPLSGDLKIARDRRCKCMLPEWLMNPIGTILEGNTKSKMRVRQTGKVPAGGGMLWFIDELIYHRTPQDSPKISGEALRLSIVKSLGFLNPTDLAPQDPWSGFSKNTARSFVRIWVTVDQPGKKDF